MRKVMEPFTYCCIRSKPLCFLPQRGRSPELHSDVSNAELEKDVAYMNSHAKPSIAGSAAWSYPAKDASRVPEGLAQLKQAHLELEGLFDQYAATLHPVKKQLLVRTLCEKLTVHTTLLTFYFYPSVLEVLGDPQDVCSKVILKYAQFKQLIAEIESASPGCDEYESKIDVLKAYFLYHVREEETLSFPRIRKSGFNLNVLGETLHKARLQVERELGRKSLKNSPLADSTLNQMLLQNNISRMQH
jgi:hypothetical protein